MRNKLYRLVEAEQREEVAVGFDMRKLSVADDSARVATYESWKQQNNAGVVTDKKFARWLDEQIVFIENFKYKAAYLKKLRGTFKG